MESISVLSRIPFKIRDRVIGDKFELVPPNCTTPRAIDEKFIELVHPNYTTPRFYVPGGWRHNIQKRKTEEVRNGISVVWFRERRVCQWARGTKLRWETGASAPLGLSSSYLLTYFLEDRQQGYYVEVKKVSWYLLPNININFWNHYR